MRRKIFENKKLQNFYKLIPTDFLVLIKEGGLYTFINVLDRVVPFILLPVIIRLISVEEFGIYLIPFIVYSLFEGFFFPNFWDFFIYLIWFYKMNNNKSGTIYIK